MERRRRLTSLRSVLLRYLCLCGGGCVLLLMIWWGIFMQLIDNGFLLSATASAQACAEARETVASMTADTFDPSAISSLCRYAVVCDANTDAERVTTTNMTARQLKTALNALHGGSGNLGMTQYQYIVTMADGATCLLQYDYAVPYADPALRGRLPDFQTCYIILLVVLVLAWLAVTTHRTVRTFTAETSRIDEATRQIAAQHPEAVDVDHARIREFSATLQALQTMGQQLTDSLQRQWQLEQQRTEQVAALAHDLKTPLTIIQGNAELLAESADTTAPELDAILRAGDRAQQYLAALRSVGTVPAARQRTDSHAFVAALADTANARRSSALFCRSNGRASFSAPPRNSAVHLKTCWTTPCAILPPVAPSRWMSARQRTCWFSLSPIPAQASRPKPCTRPGSSSIPTPPAPAPATRGWGCISPAASPRPTAASWCLPTPASGRRRSFACPCNKR